VGWFSHGGQQRACRVTLYFRNGKIISDSYLPVARALEKVKRDAMIDGELVALDAHGISRFQLLQNALRAEAKLFYCIFDIMFCDGEDLRGLPLLERKDRLRRILPKHPLLALSEHRPEHGGAAARSLRRKTCSMGFRSGEYFGKKNSLAPAVRMSWRATLPLWLPRLSRMTMSPGFKVGTRTFSI
jgi:ATP-dependent DNA ligase